MADTTIQTNAEVSSDITSSFSRGLVWINPSVGYAVYNTSVGADSLETLKTTNGENWADASLQFSSAIGNRTDVWFDKWTKGDTGGIIHVAWHNIDGVDTIEYRGLDTSDDTFEAAIKVIQATTLITNISSRVAGNITIAKAVGGNLYVFTWEDAAGGHSFWRSTDGGVNWTERTSPADGNEVDMVQLMPGNEADTNDVYLLYMDISAGEFSVKTYDDTGNSWSEVSIDASIAGNSGRSLNFDAVQRHSNGFIYVTYWNDWDSATADLRTCIIENGTTITQKTNIIDNSAESGYAGMLYNQQNDDIYVVVEIGSAFLGLVDTVYFLSTDGMGTWGSVQAYSEDTEDDYRQIWAGHSIGDAGGRFQPIVYDDDETSHFANFVNDIVIAAAAAGGGIRNPFGGPMVLRNPLGA